MVEYEEGGALVQQITAAMDHINGRALVNVQGSLRSYVLTPEVNIVYRTRYAVKLGESLLCRDPAQFGVLLPPFVT